MRIRLPRMIDFQFPFILVKTRKGLSVMERLSRASFFRRIGLVSTFAMPFLSATMLFLLLNSVYIMLSSRFVSELVRELGPAANILLPGVNPYLPIIYGWVALFIGMIVHEYSHGIQAMANGINVKSMGIVLLLVVPIGAFAEVDERQLEESGLRKSAKVLSTGPVSNILVALFFLIVFLLTILSLKPVVNGILVTGLSVNGTAYNAGIRLGDIIVGVNGKPTPEWISLSNAFSDAYSSGGNITFNILRDLSLNYFFTLRHEPRVNVSSAIDLLKHYGIVDIVPLAEVLRYYSPAFQRFPIEGFSTYLMIPTIPWASDDIPFSDMLHKYYTSTILGSNYHYVANLLFWSWFVNFNLGIFNSLPLYPLDGGIVFKLLCRSKLGGKIGLKMVDRIVYTISLLIVGLIIGVIIIPYFT
ncbi:MAG: site-2 protease family protein [Thermoproteota archaeon]